jgi:hypothetical protein
MRSLLIQTAKCCFFIRPLFPSSPCILPDPVAANISTFIGPSLSGAAVSQPKAAISPSTVSTSGAPPPTSVNITPLPVPSSSRDSQSSSNIGVIVGAVLGMGAAVLLGVALLVYCFCKRRGKKRGRALPPDDLEAEASRRALTSQGMPSGAWIARLVGRCSGFAGASKIVLHVLSNLVLVKYP